MLIIMNYHYINFFKCASDFVCLFNQILEPHYNYLGELACESSEYLGTLSFFPIKELTTNSPY